MESKCRGVFFVDSRAGDLDNSFEVSSYARVNAATTLLTNLEPQLPASFIKEITGGRELTSKIFLMWTTLRIATAETKPLLALLLLFWGHFQLNFDFPDYD
ncbi:MAG: hypothetical protein V7K35_03655 [Nostoc sp.]|uniref:hypothetical protein n=1 Tax=Nostoc sp. TaxID=1180 RepID=UPI002FFB1703